MCNLIHQILLQTFLEMQWENTSPTPPTQPSFQFQLRFLLPKSRFALMFLSLLQVSPLRVSTLFLSRSMSALGSLQALRPAPSVLTAC